MKITKLLFVTISFMFAAGICLAGESLEEKLAKLDAKIKGSQSIAKSYKTETVDNQASRKKSLDERIAELQAKQDGFSKAAAGRDVKLSSLQSKLAALDAKMLARRQEHSKAIAATNKRFSSVETKLASIDTKVETLQNDDALTKRIALLEQKIETIEEQAVVMQVKNNLRIDKDVVSKSQEPVPVAQVKSDSQVACNGVISELELNTATLEASSSQDMYEMAPVAANYLETTSVESDAISIDITADYFGKYIWRGQNLNDDPVFQSGVSFGWKGFTAGWWGSVDLGTVNNNRGEFTEHDFYLDYSGDVPFVDGVGYSVGVINYYFPSGEDTTEVYWGFGFDLPLSPSITVYHDIDDIKGTYASFGLSHSIDRIAELGPDMPIAMDIGASLGWGSGSYNKSYWSGGSGVTSSKLNDLVLSVAFPVEIAGWTLAPSLYYVTLVSDAVRDTDTYNNASDYLFAGISLSKSF